MYGFSQSQVTKHSHLVTSQRLEAAHHQVNIREKTLKHYKTETEATIKARLKEVEEAIEKAEEPNNYLEEMSALPSTKFASFQLHMDLKLEECSNLVVISWCENGIIASPLNVVQKATQITSDICIKTLFYVWCKEANTFPSSPHIIHCYEETLKLYVDKEALLSLLRPSNQLFCEECGYTVTKIHMHDRVRFNKHMKRHMVEKFTCDCDMEFTSITVKEAHYDLVHSGKDYVKCEFCTYVNTVSSVATHVKSKHEIQSHFCDVCGNEFFTKYNLEAHISTFHRVAKCPECPGLTFTGSYGLRKHKREVHAKTKPRESCPLCAKTFASKYKLKSHTLTVHTKNEDKPFQCVICGLGYPNRDKMSRHMKMHVRKKECGEDYLLPKRDERLNKKIKRQEEILKRGEERSKIVTSDG